MPGPRDVLNKLNNSFLPFPSFLPFLFSPFLSFPFISSALLSPLLSPLIPSSPPFPYPFLSPPILFSPLLSSPLPSPPLFLSSAVPSAATVVIVLCIAALVAVVVLGIYRVHLTHQQEVRLAEGAKEAEDGALTITVNPMEVGGATQGIDTPTIGRKKINYSGF